MVRESSASFSSWASRYGALHKLSVRMWMTGKGIRRDTQILTHFVDFFVACATAYSPGFITRKGLGAARSLFLVRV